jgi:probable rRNA maturation factor
MTVHSDIYSETGYKIDRKRIRQGISDLLSGMGIYTDVELSVVFAGERKMRELHKKHLGSDEVTDVISFPLEEGVFPDGVLRLGDIVICYPVAVKQAADKNIMVDDEIQFLAEHGCRHLLGIHHEL